MVDMHRPMGGRLEGLQPGSLVPRYELETCSQKPFQEHPRRCGISATRMSWDAQSKLVRVG